MSSSIVRPQRPRRPPLNVLSIKVKALRVRMSSTSEQDEILDRIEHNMALCRLPRAVTLAHRRRTNHRGADIVKQWSMDETQTWFYSRSPSLDRPENHESDKVDNDDEIIYVS